MSDQPPTTSASPRLLGCLGAILLLPGLCSLIFAIESLNDAGDTVFGGKDPSILGLWLVCFLISAGGIALIVSAIRRGRRS
jgi:hypothetical protein